VIGLESKTLTSYILGFLLYRVMLWGDLRSDYLQVRMLAWQVRCIGTQLVTRWWSGAVKMDFLGFKT